MRAHILFRKARNNDRTSCWCERGPDFTCVPSSGGHGWGDTGPPQCSHHCTTGPSWPLKTRASHNVSKGLMSFSVWGCFPLSLRWGFLVIPAGYSSLTSQCSEAGQRAGHNGGATRWWHPSNLLWATPLGSTPHSQAQFMPRKKIPWLLNFPGATVTSCGLILMCFIWKYSFQSPLPLLAWKSAVWIQAASTAICSAHPRPDSKRTDGWQTCS